MKTTVRFFRHGGICRSDVSFSFKPGPTLTAFRTGTTQAVRAHRKVLRPTHRRDEFRPVIPQRDARQQSPSPLHRHAHPKSAPGSGTMNLQRTVNSVLTVCLSPGDNPTTLSIHLNVATCQVKLHSNVHPMASRNWRAAERVNKSETGGVIV
jgi:hypothetical protein